MSHNHGNEPQQSLVLGIDIGTTTVKLCVVSQIAGGKINVVADKKIAHKAEKFSLEKTNSEYDVFKLVTCIKECLSLIPGAILQRVASIAVSCQMHGCCLWDSTIDNVESSCKTSYFANWEDKRCLDSFLFDINSMARSQFPTQAAVQNGYGWAILLHMALYHSKKLDQYDSAGSIGDYIVHLMLTDSSLQSASPQRGVCMSETMAHSWGFMNDKFTDWDHDALKNIFSSHEKWHNLGRLAPRVVPSGTLCGMIQKQTSRSHFFHLSAHPLLNDVQVFAPMGDHQCSLFSVLDDSCFVVSLGTSLQLSYLRGVQDEFPVPPPFETRPYFSLPNRLLTWASLNGGNSLDVFVTTVLTDLQNLVSEFSWLSNNSLTKDHLFKYLDNMVVKNREAANETKLICDPCFQPERNATQTYGHFSNIQCKRNQENLRVLNFSIVEQYESIILGLAQRVRSMLELDESLLQRSQICQNHGCNMQLIICGGVLGSLASFQMCFQKQFEDLNPKISLIFNQEEGSAKGAALYILAEERKKALQSNG